MSGILTKTVLTSIAKSSEQCLTTLTGGLTKAQLLTAVKIKESTLTNALTALKANECGFERAAQAAHTEFGDATSETVQQFSLWPLRSTPGEGTRPTRPT